MLLALTVFAGLVLEFVMTGKEEEEQNKVNWLRALLMIAMPLTFFLEVVFGIGAF